MLKYAIFGILTLAVVGYGLFVLFPAALRPSPDGAKKRWGYLFAIVLLAEALAFPAAALMDLWLPKGVSTYSGPVDLLWNVILAVTGLTFIAVSSVFVYALFKFPAQAGRKSLYTHGSHTLEKTWSGITAGILVILAVVQIPIWNRMKVPDVKDLISGAARAVSSSAAASPTSGVPPLDAKSLQIEVVARQWEWRMRYASLDHMREWDQDSTAALKDMRLKLPARPDDVRRVNEIHCVKFQKVLIHLKTMDVIHSFYLPHMRLKQDALPGRTMLVWFEATEANTVKRNGDWLDGMRFDESKKDWVQDGNHIWELACAEYCGSRHSLMRGKVYVHADQKDFEDWLTTAEKEGRATTESKDTK